MEEQLRNENIRLKSIVSALQKSVECPVCLETVTPPFKLCVGGHSVCIKCMDKLEKCPLCQGLFVLENPVCLKNMLEALPHTCCYSDEGCEEIIEPGNDHVMFCGFRPIVCRYRGCSVKIPLVKVLDHYETNHAKNIIVTSRTPNFLDNLEILELQYAPVSLFNNIFWIYIIKDVTAKQLKFYFQATPIGKLEHDYYVRVEFKSEEIVYIHTIKAEVLSSCETKLEGKQSEQPDDEYCMKIPLNELHNFLNDKGKHAYSFHFFEKKNPTV